jgi:hypothetical protein
VPYLTQQLCARQEQLIEPQQHSCYGQAVVVRPRLIVLQTPDSIRPCPLEVLRCKTALPMCARLRPSTHSMHDRNAHSNHWPSHFAVACDMQYQDTEIDLMQLCSASNYNNREGCHYSTSYLQNSFSDAVQQWPRQKFVFPFETVFHQNQARRCGVS